MRTIIAILCLLLALPVYAGTWGYGQFENDEALDRSSDWADSGSAADIRRALEAVQQLPYVEAPEAMTALVAAEVVAAALGRPSDDLPQDLKSWLAAQATQELEALAPLARAAISKVTAPESSELYELWAEDVSDWLLAVADLESRLAVPRTAAGP